MQYQMTQKEVVGRPLSVVILKLRSEILPTKSFLPIPSPTRKPKSYSGSDD
jgi:hypothetical protein